MATKSLADLATEFDGHVLRGAVRVPASKVVAFLDAARVLELNVPYVECLFVGQSSTRPSMELSRERQDFETFDLFVAFVRHAAALAEDEAKSEGVQAQFEVGVVSS